MKYKNSFLSENISISVLGHLLVVGGVVLSASVFSEFDTDKLIAPDRVQIMEIDLNNIKVAGVESKLYNTNPIDSSVVENKKSEPVQNHEESVSAESDDAKIETSSAIVQDVVDTNKKEPDKKEETVKKVEDTPAPKKKTVVRVNRDVVSLERTMTVSVVDALRVAMTRCWTIDTSRPDLNGIRAVAHLTMRPNGTVADVWFESGARAETDPVFAYVLGTIRSAINVCQPFKMLPQNEFKKWEKIQLTFYPTQGKVM